MQFDKPITKTVYRVIDFVNWQRQHQLDLRPRFQRGSVWSSKTKSLFIDSLARGYPIPIVFIQDTTKAETLENIRQVVDGQQRLRTAIAFIDPDSLDDFDKGDNFSVLPIHNEQLAGKRFGELELDVQQRILNYEFSVHVLPSDTPAQLLLNVFARMNSTGVPVTRQELRNAEFHGACKELCYQTSGEALDLWLTWKVFSPKQIARMRDVELTSELFLFMIEELDRKNQDALDRFYGDYDDDMPHAEEMHRRFWAVMKALEEVFSNVSKPLFATDPESKLDLRGHSASVFDDFATSPFNTQGWFYVLFADIYERLFNIASLDSRPRPRRIDIDRIRRLLEDRASELASDGVDPDLLKALRGAATDRSSRLTRLRYIQSGT